MSQILLRNIKFGTKWYEIRDYCERYGDVRWVEVLFNSKSKMLGWALVSFIDKEAGERAATDLHEVKWKGRYLKAANVTGPPKVTRWVVDKK
ncbi:heterogeneous nuclear ribonucleoprotein M-like [Clavelina lepadiformis]|uniref:heterogeneous nuclear ribonucleoprotein M-like n=1 Tax=Clavelina lepadiformis TaxID=159417 RepID=UPI004042364A